MQHRIHYNIPLMVYTLSNLDKHTLIEDKEVKRLVLIASAEALEN